MVKHSEIQASLSTGGTLKRENEYLGTVALRFELELAKPVRVEDLIEESRSNSDKQLKERLRNALNKAEANQDEYLLAQLGRLEKYVDTLVKFGIAVSEVCCLVFAPNIAVLIPGSRSWTQLRRPLWPQLRTFLM